MPLCLAVHGEHRHRPEAEEQCHQVEREELTVVVILSDATVVVAARQRYLVFHLRELLLQGEEAVAGLQLGITLYDDEERLQRLANLALASQLMPTVAAGSLAA